MTTGDRETLVFNRHLAAPSIKPEVKRFFAGSSACFPLFDFSFYFAGFHQETYSILGDAGHCMLDLKGKKG